MDFSFEYKFTISPLNDIEHFKLCLKAMFVIAYCTKNL